MKRSKIIFFAVAAVVVIAVILAMMFSPEQTPAGPTTGPNISPSGATTGPSLELPPTIFQTTPGGETVPADPYGPDLPILPSEGENSDPFEKLPETPCLEFVPNEKTAADLPESTDEYLNQRPVGLNVVLDGNTYYLEFGISKAGTSDYIYLSPSLKNVTMGSDQPSYLQFYFEPSFGYVTTISNAKYGEYSAKECHSTFNRAFDYALPSCYVSEEEPGTVWFTDKPSDERYYGMCRGYIDVTCYCKGRLFAVVRLLIVHSDEGYRLFHAQDMNYMNTPSDMFGVLEPMSAEQKDTLIAQMKADALANCSFFSMYDYDIEGMKPEDIVIVKRDPGQGTYFDYYTGPDFWTLLSREELEETTLYAVSYRCANYIYKPAPATIYYKMVMGENGDYSFEIVGVEQPRNYYRHTLYYSYYPGYSEPVE